MDKQRDARQRQVGGFAVGFARRMPIGRARRSTSR